MVPSTKLGAVEIFFFAFWNCSPSLHKKTLRFENSAILVKNLAFLAKFEIWARYFGTFWAGRNRLSSWVESPLIQRNSAPVLKSGILRLRLAALAVFPVSAYGLCLFFLKHRIHNFSSVACGFEVKFQFCSFWIPDGICLLDAHNIYHVPFCVCFIRTLRLFSVTNGQRRSIIRFTLWSERFINLFICSLSRYSMRQRKHTFFCLLGDYFHAAKVG